MNDLRFFDKNNQRKEVSAFASAPLSTSATLDDLLFTLPEAAVVTNVYAIVLTPSGVSASNIDIKVGSTVVATNLDVATAGVSRQLNATTYKDSNGDTVTVITKGIDPVYFPTGGSVTATIGSTAPDSAGVLKIVVEYTETVRSEGTYTD